MACMWVTALYMNTITRHIRQGRNFSSKLVTLEERIGGEMKQIDVKIAKVAHMVRYTMNDRKVRCMISYDTARPL